MVEPTAEVRFGSFVDPKENSLCCGFGVQFLDCKCLMSDARSGDGRQVGSPLLVGVYRLILQCILQSCYCFVQPLVSFLQNAYLDFHSLNLRSKLRVVPLEKRQLLFQPTTHFLFLYFQIDALVFHLSLQQLL